MEDHLVEEKLRRYLKAAAWERAKGALREIVALEGARTSSNRHSGETQPFEVISTKFETFIDNIEKSGDHE